MISLFRDDCLSGSERKYYNWLTERFPQSDYLVYPNIALQAIFNSEIKEDLKSGWASHEVLDEQNFVDTSSADLCVIDRKTYQPVFAIEIDGITHQNSRLDNINLTHEKREELRLRDALREQRDDLKDHIFNLAGLPLRRIATCDKLSPRQNRLPFRKRDGNDSDSDKEDKEQLTEAIRQLNDEYERNHRARNSPKTKNLLFGIKDYYDLLNKMLPPDQYIVFPNMALQSILGAEAKTQFDGRLEKQSVMTSLVDFCLASASDVRPLIAFNINRDEIKEKVLQHFGLPLLYLPRLEPQ